MKIIYVHHAERKVCVPKTDFDPITFCGRFDAHLVANFFAKKKKNGEKFKAIFTSPAERCLQTAKIINKKLMLPIFEEPRFCEFNSLENKSWNDMQKDVIDAIKDIVFMHEDKDCVVCVTSGVNIAAFFLIACGIKPNSKVPFIGVPMCCPLVFEITKDMFEK